MAMYKARAPFFIGKLLLLLYFIAYEVEPYRCSFSFLLRMNLIIPKRSLTSMERTFPESYSWVCIFVSVLHFLPFSELFSN